MNRRSWSEIFETINNPGVPVLFLLGTMIFAVLGNALYDLLVSTIQGQTGSTGDVVYVIITVFAFLALLGIVIILWFWYNLRRRRRSRLSDTVKLTQTYPVLLLFVSANPRGSEWTAIQHHFRDSKLQQLWLIASAEAEKKAQQLREQVQQRYSQSVRISILPIASAYDIPQAYRVVTQIFELIVDQIDQAIVDITSGTKQMSAGAVLACREYGVPMQYVVADLKGGKVDEGSEGELMKVLL